MDIEVKAFYVDGTNPTRSEDPLEIGWHYATREWRNGAWSQWAPSEKAYDREEQALAAGNALRSRSRGRRQD